jgi:hypothetical protein
LCPHKFSNVLSGQGFSNAQTCLAEEPPVPMWATDAS